MKTIGILGGVGPQTTSKIYHSIIDSFRKDGDGKYPSIIIYNLPFPFKVEQEAIIEGRNSQKMLPYLLTGAKILEKSGADFGILPCNTLHKYIDQIRKSTKVKFLSILEEVVKELKVLNIKKIAVLATASSVNDRLYGSLLNKNGIEIIYPVKKDQRDLDKMIVRLIENKQLKTDGSKFEEISIRTLKKGSEAVLLACTDLQAFTYNMKSKIQIIDSSEILIKASLKEMLGK